MKKRPLIKWRDYEIETFITIRSEMENEFVKSAKNKI